MNKFLSGLAIFGLLASILPVKTATASDTGYFIVTAYYSPLPNQDRYATGNYEKEKILNGQGKAGASGRKVFSGMLAAPGKYSFGTKIYLEGLGIGSVEDRGGAIVEAGKRGFEHDRIDVWMGYGDEGLRRAMYWGKRKVKGHVTSKGSDPSIAITTIPSPTWIAKYIRKPSGVTRPNVFNTSVGTKSNPNDIKQLQTFLKSIGKYNGKISGVYNKEVMDFVYDFQIENKLITDWNDTYAGYWGSSVRNTLSKQYLRGDFDVKQKEIEKELSHEEKLEELFNNSLNTIEETKFLQELLTSMEVYTGEINGVYSDIRDTILEYQLDNNVINSDSDQGAGYFGPKTRASLKEKHAAWKDSEAKKEIIKNKFNELIKTSEEEAKVLVGTLGNPEFGEIGTHVRSLQKLLTELGYFDYKDTAIFGVKTQNAIIKYQIASSIIKTPSDLGAGILGPKTKEQLQRDIKGYILKENLKSSGILDTIELLKIKKETPSEVSRENKLKINLI